MTGPTPDHEIHELASIGARWAASALAQLVGRAVLTRAPQVRPPDAPLDPARWTTGVFFEAEGDMTGLVALLVDDATREGLARSLLQADGADDHPEAMESALREVGNIVASQTVSAIANTLGARVLLSVPTLAPREAAEVFNARAAERGDRAEAQIDCELFDRSGEVNALLVFAPDRLKPE